MALSQSKSSSMFYRRLRFNFKVFVALIAALTLSLGYPLFVMPNTGCDLKSNKCDSDNVISERELHAFVGKSEKIVGFGENVSGFRRCICYRRFLAQDVNFFGKN